MADKEDDKFYENDFVRTWAAKDDYPNEVDIIKVVRARGEYRNKWLASPLDKQSFVVVWLFGSMGIAMDIPKGISMGTPMGIPWEYQLVYTWVYPWVYPWEYQWVYPWQYGRVP